VRVLGLGDLDGGNFSRSLVGADHDAEVCLILVEAPPGSGPALHRHPYEELFVLHEGEGTFTAGDEERVVAAPAVLVVPAGTPHRFVNSGEGPLSMTTIHPNPRFETEWLE
jgi:mannose-6-phosphate isomerase-like protein (cupin superfamily)